MSPFGVAKAGDIIGFSGRYWESSVINLCTLGIPRWGLSHVGIIADDLRLRGGLLLYESTSLGTLPCEIMGAHISGMQAHTLEDSLAGYDGRVWRYPLSRRLYAHERSRLRAYMADSIGKPYDRAGAMRSGGLLLATVGSMLSGQDLSELFCSEAIASAISTVGLMPFSNASAWNPNALVRKLRRIGLLHSPERLK